MCNTTGAVDPGSAVGHNVKMLLAYDGSSFRGLAENPGVRTVVGELRSVIADLCAGRCPSIIMAGRTDAGVHATGQVLSCVFDDEQWAELNRRGGLMRLQRSINTRLGPEVVVSAIEQVCEGFHARFSATGRRYYYTIINRLVNDPLLAKSAWLVTEPLDMVLLNDCCPYFIGEKDFSSFCRSPHPDASLVRRVNGARWHDLSSSFGPGVIRFEIEGSAFCHQMVRSIVGFMVEVGRCRRRAEEIPAVLEAKDRNRASQPAPPHGLVLWQVDYDD